MWKKILMSVIFAGLIGVLIWGGVNRTLAKAGDQEIRNRQNNEKNSNYAYLEENDINQRTQIQGGTDDDIQRGRRGPPVEHKEDGDNESSAENTQGFQGNNFQRGDQQQGYRSGGRWGNGNGGGNALGTPDESDIEALHLALDDEYNALATYRSVIDTFGEIEPFTTISLSEQRHIDALVNQFIKFNVPVPENPWIGNGPTFESITQACQAGVDAEIANEALYDKLFSMTDRTDLLRVFTNLRRASLESHLPEFEACSQ